MGFPLLLQRWHGEQGTGQLLHPGPHIQPTESVGRQHIFLGPVSEDLTLLLSTSLNSQQCRLYLEGWNVPLA